MPMLPENEANRVLLDAVWLCSEDEQEEVKISEEDIDEILSSEPQV